MRDLLFLDRLDAGAVSLGCSACPHLKDCGGFTRQGGGWDCLDLCMCTDKSKCDKVCPRRTEEFPLDMAEVRGFSMDNVGNLASRVPRPALPAYIPVIHSGSKRSAPLITPWAALPLQNVCASVGKEPYATRLGSKDDYLGAFKLGSQTRLLLLAVGKDRHLERYWEFKGDGTLAKLIAKAGFDAAVPPNFSFFLDEPRTQHMHARKRSLICASEFAQEDITPIVYLHALSAGDWKLWENFLRNRPEVTLVCKEFQTGGASPAHSRAKIRYVADLEQRLGRQLHLVAVGGGRYIRDLQRHLTAWTLVDSMPYMRTVKRQQAFFYGGRLRWRSAHGLPLDDLLKSNLREYERWVSKFNRSFSKAA